MAVTTKQEQSALNVSTTELSLINGTSTIATSTTAAGIQLFVDGSNMVKADEFVVRGYEKVVSGGTQRQFYKAWIDDTQIGQFFTPIMMVMNGWDFTLLKTAGTARNFDTSLRQCGAITEYQARSALSVSTTELSFVSGTSSLQSKTDAGIYQLWLDVSALTKADEFRVRLYEKTRSASGSQGRPIDFVIHGAQSELWVTPPMELLNGWDMTIIKVAGTDRAVDASIRKAG